MRFYNRVLMEGFLYLVTSSSILGRSSGIRKGFDMTSSLGAELAMFHNAAKFRAWG